MIDDQAPFRVRMRIYATCAECAMKSKAVWPKGHIGSAYVGECPFCLRTRTICSVSDWQWPFGLPPLAEAEGLYADR